MAVDDRGVYICVDASETDFALAELFVIERPTKAPPALPVDNEIHPDVRRVVCLVILRILIFIICCTSMLLSLRRRGSEEFNKLYDVKKYIIESKRNM